MSPTRDYLFRKGDLSATLDGHRQHMTTKVDSIPKEQLLATPVEDLVEHVVSDFVVTPLTIYEERMVQEQRETEVDVSGWPGRDVRSGRPCLVAGIEVTISLPFTGATRLWELQPNAWGSMYPFGFVQSDPGSASGVLLMTFTLPSGESLETMKGYLNQNLGLIRDYIGSQKPQVEKFNSELPRYARSLIEARRQRLVQHDKLTDVLGIPLKRNPSAPEIRPIQVERRIVKPLPPPPTGGYKPEPGITNEQYEHILSIIRHEGRTFESTPNTFFRHPEEELRDIILAHLNGHYKGAASGETFRRSGKTDIRIEAESRAAFITECKVWRGAQQLSEAITQLLSYLTWRDCKCAIVVFNKQVASFSEVLNKIPGVFEGHARFLKPCGTYEGGEWRFSFRSQEDDARLVHIHVFAFNLFVQKQAKEE